MKTLLIENCAHLFTLVIEEVNKLRHPVCESMTSLILKHTQIGILKLALKLCSDTIWSKKQWLRNTDNLEDDIYIKVHLYTLSQIFVMLRNRTQCVHPRFNLVNNLRLVYQIIFQINGVGTLRMNFKKILKDIKLYFLSV